MMPLGFVWMVLKTSSRNVRWKLVINWWTDFKKGYYKFVDENVKDNVGHQPWSCHSRLLNVSSNKKHREWFDETEQVIITQFGKPVGDIITEFGLKIKVPFIQKLNRIEKQHFAVG